MPVSHAWRNAAAAFAGSPAAAGEGAIDFWEEVALAPLRLAQLALILALLGTAVVAPIMG